MTFKNAVQNTVEYTTTANGAKTLKSSLNACVDLFFTIGSCRNSGLNEGLLTRAFASDPDVATRIVAWARDVRGGAGERKVFRDALDYFGRNDEEVLAKLIAIAPEVGRWDDILTVGSVYRKKYAYPLIKQALNEGNGLCAKWMPRKGNVAVELRLWLGLTPKQYRKLLVNTTDVVETKMCNREFKAIDYSHVPSVAMSKYRTAFYRNDEERFSSFIDKAVKGEAKINASAIFPHDVIKPLVTHGRYGTQRITKTSTEGKAILAQWEALPNFLGDDKILPMVDVSGSMGCRVGGSTTLTCMDVAVSLGLYLADKQEGAFKDMFLTFSERSRINVLEGDLFSKVQQLCSADWGMNTNIQSAFNEILKVALKNKLSQEDMPAYLLILSDMEFDYCGGKTNFKAAAKKFKEAGYEMPKVVFWNLNARAGNSPVKANKDGVALVSGYSPSICKSILAAENMTPESIMLSAVMNDRYKVI